MLSDIGVYMKIAAYAGACVAKGIANHKESVNIRHRDVNQLWVQDRIARGDIIIRKVGANDNMADILTKHVDRNKIDTHMENMNMEFAEGRHDLAPAI